MKVIKMGCPTVEEYKGSVKCPECKSELEIVAPDVKWSGCDGPPGNEDYCFVECAVCDGRIVLGTQQVPATVRRVARSRFERDVYTHNPLEDDE